MRSQEEERDDRPLCVSASRAHVDLGGGNRCCVGSPARWRAPRRGSAAMLRRERQASTTRCPGSSRSNACVRSMRSIEANTAILVVEIATARPKVTA
jgi:hypothetical protein